MTPIEVGRGSGGKTSVRVIALTPVVVFVVASILLVSISAGLTAGVDYALAVLAVTLVTALANVVTMVLRR